jgi:hypothetical protein
MALCLLFVVVVLGATGVFGVRARSVRVEGNGYTLTVTYPLSAVLDPRRPVAGARRACLW